MKDNKFLECVKSAKDNVESELKQGNPLMWHRIIMCVCIGFIGIAVMGGIILDFIMDKQNEAIRRLPVVGVAENAVLPEGEYCIYRAFFDESNRTHYHVSLEEGGIVVSVLPPKGTAEPADIHQILRYDPAAYKISVDAAGNWTFLPTSVMEQIKARTQQVRMPQSPVQELQGAP